MKKTTFHVTGGQFVVPDDVTHIQGISSLDVDEEFAGARNAIDGKFAQVAHQQRLKVQQKAKKARKKRK